MTMPAVTSQSNDNIFPSTFKAVYVRESGGKWQTLGSIYDTELDDETFTKNDSRRRPRGQGASKITAKCKMMQASITELELLPTLCNGANDFLFQLIESEAIPVTTPAATTGWVLVTAAQIKAVHARFVADGDESDEQYIELDWQGAALDSELDAMLKASIADIHFASSADSATAVFYTIGTYTAAKDGGRPSPLHYKPCGVSTLTLADHAGGDAQTISPIMNFKLSYDFTVQTEGVRQYPTNAVMISASFESLSTIVTDMLIQNSINSLELDAVITMRNGMVHTLTDVVGHKVSLQSKGDMDKSRVNLYTLEGAVLKSAFNALVA